MAFLLLAMLWTNFQCMGFTWNWYKCQGEWQSANDDEQDLCPFWNVFLCVVFWLQVSSFHIDIRHGFLWERKRENRNNFALWTVNYWSGYININEVRQQPSISMSIIIIILQLIGVFGPGWGKCVWIKMWEFVFGFGFSVSKRESCHFDAYRSRMLFPWQRIKANT